MSSAVCCLLALGRDCHSGAVKAPFPPVPPQPSGRASVDGAPSQCPANAQGFASYKSKSSESPSGPSHLQGSALHGHRIATCSAFLGARLSSHSQPHFLVLMPSCSPPHQVLGLAMWLALTNEISAPEGPKHLQVSSGIMLRRAGVVPQGWNKTVQRS
ncbi:hypothetical protein VULLAG_LOCUS3877 [Vulpes lagopus]